jgi:hypothetical protein
MKKKRDLIKAFNEGVPLTSEQMSVLTSTLIACNRQLCSMIKSAHPETWEKAKQWLDNELESPAVPKPPAPVKGGVAAALAARINACAAWTSDPERRAELNALSARAVAGEESEEFCREVDIKLSKSRK